MEQESLRVEFGGKEFPALYHDLVSLEVDIDDELIGMFRISVALVQRADGTWPYLDDEQIQLWQPVAITARLGSAEEKLLSGYITHLRPDFSGSPGHCLLEIWGMDASVLMDRHDRLKDWPNRRDSEIAKEIFESYGLDVQITDTATLHDERVSTIIQRETDIRFLKRLGRRNGFECFVADKTGHFHPAELTRAAQPVLSVQFGEQTTVSRFTLQVDMLGPSRIGLTHLDQLAKDIVEVNIDAPNQKVLGAKSSKSLLPAGIEPASVQLGQVVTTGQAETSALCSGLFDSGEWFVTGEGEVAANTYGTILMPRRTVTIKGIGDIYSGDFYVTRVSHVFTPVGYSQCFSVKRNALVPLGSEKFTVGADSLLNLLS